MKKLLFLLIFSGGLFVSKGVQAQFRSVPGIVTDSFKLKYPNAAAVSWSDKLSGFQATFMLDKDRYIARYGNKGEWQWSTKRITKDEMPGPVKDGLAKSLYAGAEWQVNNVTMRFLPGNTVQYAIFVQKSDLNKKNLLFSSEGQLLKDTKTL